MKLLLCTPRTYTGEWTEIVNKGLGGSKSQSEHPEGETNVLHTNRELNHVRVVAQSVYRPFYSDS